MGPRKMTGVERKRAHALASSLLFVGESKDTVIGKVMDYLTGQCWERGAAHERAREVYYRAVMGDAPPPGGTTP